MEEQLKLNLYRVNSNPKEKDYTWRTNEKRQHSQLLVT
jgi:hypothetical protein